MRAHTLFLLLLLPFTGFGQLSELTNLHSGTNSSLRGLDTYGDSSVWVSGSNGYIGRSNDLGKTWNFFTIAGYDSAEFRDIELIDAHTILVMSSIHPACILRSTDDGATWKEVFRDESDEMFLDAMDVTQGKCVCMGDPLNNKMVMLFSSDSGKVWNLKNNLRIPDSTAAFAASGSVIKWIDANTLYFATGGKTSNLYFSYDAGDTWRVVTTPMLCGQPPQGIFTMDFISAKTGVIAGGDYTTPDAHEKNIYYTDNGGKDFMPLHCKSAGYISCAKFIGKKEIITCGTNGIHLFDTGSGNESKISAEGFNVIMVTEKRIFFAGNNGKVSMMEHR